MSKKVTKTKTPTKKAGKKAAVKTATVKTAAVKKATANKKPAKKLGKTAKAKSGQARVFDTLEYPPPGGSDLNSNQPFQASGSVNAGTDSGTATLYYPDGTSTQIPLTITDGSWTANFGNITFTPGAGLRLVITTVDGDGDTNSTGIQFWQQMPATGPNMNFQATPAANQSFDVNGSATGADSLTVNINSAGPTPITPGGFDFTATMPAGSTSGNIALAFIATDADGNTTEFDNTLTVDLTLPSFQPATPNVIIDSDDSVTPNDTTTDPGPDNITIQGDVVASSAFTDESAVTATVIGPPGNVAFTLDNDLSTDTKTITYNIHIDRDGLPSGTYTATLTAVDVFSNTNSASASFSL